MVGVGVGYRVWVGVGERCVERVVGVGIRVRKSWRWNSTLSQLHPQLSPTLIPIPSPTLPKSKPHPI